MDPNINSTLSAIMAANGATSSSDHQRDDSSWFPPIGRPTQSNSSRGPGMSSGQPQLQAQGQPLLPAYMQFAAAGGQQAYLGGGAATNAVVSSERGDGVAAGPDASALDPRLMAELGMAANGMVGVGGGGGGGGAGAGADGPPGVGGMVGNELTPAGVDGYIGYGAAAYIPPTGSNHAAYAQHPQSSSRTPLYPGGNVDASMDNSVKRSISAASSRSRSRSPPRREQHPGGWTITEGGYDTAVPSRHPDLHSLAAAAAAAQSLERDDDKRLPAARAGTTTRGKAGRSRITRALLADSSNDLETSVSTRSRGRAATAAGRGWGMSTSDVRGGSHESAGDGAMSDDSAGRHGMVDLDPLSGGGGPSAKRRKIGKLDTAVSMGSTASSAGGHPGESPLDAERSKEDIKRQKNREKQARLRNRRANELEMLQEMARQQRDEIKALKQTLAIANAERENEVAESRRQIGALKSWVSKLESVLTSEGRWTATADIRKKMKELHGLREDDMDFAGMDNDVSGSRASQEYAVSIQGNGSKPSTAHAVSPFQQEHDDGLVAHGRRRAEGSGRPSRSAGKSERSATERMKKLYVPPPPPTTVTLLPRGADDGYRVRSVANGRGGIGIINTRDIAAGSGSSTGATRTESLRSWPSSSTGTMTSTFCNSSTPGASRHVGLSVAMRRPSLDINLQSLQPKPGSVRDVYAAMSSQSPDVMRVSNLIGPKPGNTSPVFSTASLKRIDSRTSAVSDADVMPGSVSGTLMVPRWSTDVQLGEDTVVRSPWIGQTDLNDFHLSFPLHFDTSNVRAQFLDGFPQQQTFDMLRNVRLQTDSELSTISQDFGTLFADRIPLPEITVEAAWNLSCEGTIRLAQRLILLRPESDYMPDGSLDRLSERDLPTAEANLQTIYANLRKTAQADATQKELKTARAFEVATALPQDCPSGIFGPTVEGPSSLPWRTRYTPAHRIVLMRALIFQASKPGKKDYFDNKRFSEIPPESQEVIQMWKKSPNRDTRLELLPAGLIHVNILVRGGPSFDSDAFIADLLEEGRLFGDPYEMYAWEPPDKFWYRWRQTFPLALGFCRGLRPWRRLRNVSGATPYQIIMGTERRPGSRIDGEFSLPDEGWSANESDELTWRGKKKTIVQASGWMAVARR